MAAAPATPRLTGAPVLGVLPATPLIHTIAATGQRPLTFAATGLPAGVTLDSATGRLSGSIAAAGEHAVTVKVTNATGSDERVLTIVAGNTLALTPPMGWNSYDSFDDSVTEAETIEQAEWQAANLMAHGWEYVVVDFRWYDPNAPGSSQTNANAALTADSNGRLQPATNRFPSSSGGRGFKGIADQVHALGLKFGIHIMRGIPRQAQRANSPILDSSYTATQAADTASICWWNSDMFGVRGAAGQAWYNSIFKQYAEWEVDFVKVDDSTYNRDPVNYHAEEVEFIHNAIVASGRSMVLSLSPGETPTSAQSHLLQHANMWRMSDDFWDRWADLGHMFDLSNNWQTRMARGRWPDADMLPLGFLGPRCPVEASQRSSNRTRFTRNEQVTMLSLWALLPSPLMLGANMARSNDTFLTALLTNEEMIAVNQDALGAGARSVQRQSNREVWIRNLSGERKAVGLFNRGNDDQAVTATFAQLGLTGRYRVRDVWKRQDLGLMDTLNMNVSYHGGTLLVLTPESSTGGMGGMGGAAGGAAGAAGSAGTNGGGGSNGGVAGTAGNGGVASAAGGNSNAGSAGSNSGGSAGSSSPAGGASPAGGSVASGGRVSGGSAGNAPQSGGSGAPATEPPDQGGSSCGCSLPGSVGSQAGLWATCLLLLVGAQRRRAGRRRS